MADETTSTDRPLDHLAETEQRLAGDNRPSDKPTNKPEPDESMPAAARLRAFEDEHFGEDAVRIDGKVERGSGSPYQRMGEDERRQYQALERLVAAEMKRDAARAAAAAAEAEYDEAERAVDGAADE